MSKASLRISRTIARVFCWDIWNEPDNGPEVSRCDLAELAAKAALVVPLLCDAFGWARAQAPHQPLTSGLWLGDWSSPQLLSAIQSAQITQSDVISFHNYGGAEDFARRIGWLQVFDRPLLCTEFMARPTGSTFAAILPVAQAMKVGAWSWGLVRGKTQTHLPWDSWQTPYHRAAGHLVSRHFRARWQRARPGRSDADPEPDGRLMPRVLHLALAVALTAVWTALGLRRCLDPRPRMALVRAGQLPADLLLRAAAHRRDAAATGQQPVVAGLRRRRRLDHARRGATIAARPRHPRRPVVRLHRHRHRHRQPVPARLADAVGAVRRCARHVSARRLHPGAGGGALAAAGGGAGGGGLSAASAPR